MFFFQKGERELTHGDAAVSPSLHATPLLAFDADFSCEGMAGKWMSMNEFNAATFSSIQTFVQ